MQLLARRLPKAVAYEQVATTEDEEACDGGHGKTVSPRTQHSPSTAWRLALTVLRKGFAICVVVLCFKLLQSTTLIRKGLHVLATYPEQINLRHTEETLEHAGPRSRDLAAQENEKFRSWLADVQSRLAKYPEQQFKGRGIVFSGGRATMLRQIMSQIIYLRETLHCTLPVEVMHLGPEEMTAEWRAALLSLPGDVRVVDLYSLIDPITGSHVTRPVGSPTHIKPAVVLLSSFEEVIFLDTNNFAMLDPAELFERDQYKRDGYLMWSDLWLSTSLVNEYATYSLLQVPPPAGFENSESGVMYWNKARRWKELVTAWALAKPLPARGTIDGDKQMYGFAFAATGQLMRHTFPRASVVGTLRSHAFGADTFLPLGIHQPDPRDGGPGFFHSMGFAKALAPFSKRGVSHVMDMTAAEAEPDFTVLDLSTSHAPYGLGRPVRMDAGRCGRMLVPLEERVRARAMAARAASADPRVVRAFGESHPDFAITALSWIMGRT